MNSTPRPILIVVFAFALCGCAPGRYVSAPGASGRVLDAQSRSPVPGALVTLTPAWYMAHFTFERIVIPPGGNPSKKSRTLRDGTFRIRPQHRWYMKSAFYTGTVMLVPSPSIVTIEAAGYEPLAANIPMQLDVDVVEFGAISLKKVKEE